MALGPPKQSRGGKTKSHARRSSLRRGRTPLPASTPTLTALKRPTEPSEPTLSLRTGHPSAEVGVGLAKPLADLIADILRSGQIDNVIEGLAIGKDQLPWHRLYLKPEPQGQGSLRPTFTWVDDASGLVLARCRR